MVYIAANLRDKSTFIAKYDALEANPEKYSDRNIRAD